MDWSNLKADYERLGSYTAVAREYGASKATVAWQAKRQGINPQPEGRSLAIDWSELPALYASGLTFEQLASHYDCSIHAIQNAMRRLGVTARDRGGSTREAWTPERRQNHRAAITTPEYRANARAKLLKRLPTMTGPSANSPLERFLQAALIQAGISFSTQRVLLGRYCVDVLLQQAPVVIEADGAHHYLRKQQDAERDANLTAAGYTVYRFTGADINRDAPGCIGKVVRECGLVRDVNPVADIRTGMMGAENPNWNGGPQTVPCGHCGKPVTKDAYNARIAKKKFCDSKCYGNWMREHPEQSNRRLAIDWSDLPDQYASGQTMRQLATRYGCSVHAVTDAMQHLGIEPRKPGRRRKEESRPQ
jgi:very-short-patch-repair endonuclease